MEFQDLKAENMRLSAELEESKDVYQTLDTYTSILREERNALRKEVEELRAEKTLHLKQNTQLEQLKRDLTLKEPLFRVGVAIRARFLGHSRNLVLTPAEVRMIHQWMVKDDTHYQIIIAGNDAAHRGLGLADHSLFEKGVLHHGVQKGLKLVFTKLYGTTPEKYKSMTPTMQVTMDCEVTIKTVFVLNRALRPLKERETAATDIEEIKRKYATCSQEAFEGDTDVARRVKRVQEMTAMILQEDRKRLDASELGGSWK